MGQDSVDGIGIPYRPDSPGDQIPVRKRFSAPIQTGPGAQPASYTVGTGSFSRG